VRTHAKGRGPGTERRYDARKHSVCTDWLPRHAGGTTPYNLLRGLHRSHATQVTQESPIHLDVSGSLRPPKGRDAAGPANCVGSGLVDYLSGQLLVVVAACEGTALPLGLKASDEGGASGIPYCRRNSCRVGPSCRASPVLYRARRVDSTGPMNINRATAHGNVHCR
jgi:hypothetical protein